MTIQRTPPSLVSGLRPIDRSFETWWVRPGSATVVELHGGDRVTVIDPDGGQPAELTVLDDPAALGLRADAPATVLRSLLESGEDDGFLSRVALKGSDP